MIVRGPYKTGDKVKIVRGPYKGNEGVIVPSPPRKVAIYVKFSALRESVPVLPSWITKI